VNEAVAEENAAEEEEEEEEEEAGRSVPHWASLLDRTRSCISSSEAASKVVEKDE
jgi:hypothetical protein